MQECDANGPTSMKEKPDMPEVVSHLNAVEQIAKPIDAVVENTEEQSDPLAKETGERNLCLAGGVALNCVANGILLREKIFDNIF